MAWLCGVPRVRNRARTFFSSTSVRAFSAASLGSNLSSSDTSSIFCPWIPPRPLTISMYSLAPSVVSPTPAATVAGEPAVCPITICALAMPGHAATMSAKALIRNNFFTLFSSFITAAQV